MIAAAGAALEFCLAYGVYGFRIELLVALLGNFDKLLILIVYPKADTLHIIPVASWSAVVPVAKRLLVRLLAARMGKLP
jgi:hypothetical protein